MPCLKQLWYNKDMKRTIILILIALICFVMYNPSTVKADASSFKVMIPISVGVLPVKIEAGDITFTTVLKAMDIAFEGSGYKKAQLNITVGNGYTPFMVCYLMLENNDYTTLTVPIVFNVTSKSTDISGQWYKKDSDGYWRYFSDAPSFTEMGEYCLGNDNKAPKISLFLDSKNGVYKIFPGLNIEGSISDQDGVGVDPATVSFKLDNKTADVSYDKDMGNFSLNTNSIKTGKHIFTVTASDTVGNKSTKSYTLLYDVPLSPPVLKDAVYSNNAVTLTWDPAKKGSSDIASYTLYRKINDDGSFKFLSMIPISSKSYTDKDTEKKGTYYYYLKARDSMGHTAVSNIVYVGVKGAVPVPPPKPGKETVIIMYPNNPYMTVNGVKKEIDNGRGTSPIIVPAWNRTVVPIRAIVEALGGTIEWDGVSRKVTIHFNGTTIELWIDKPQAKVNGKTEWIDNGNHYVMPIIKNSRTMLPLRFVAESMGCSVDWDGKTQKITITYKQ